MPNKRFFNELAERALIGAVIINPPLLDELNVPAEAFYSATHQKIWNAILDKYTNTGTVDVIIIQSALEDDNSAVEELAEILATETISSNAQEYASEIMEKWTARRLHSTIVAAVDEIRMGNKPASEVGHIIVEEIDKAINETEDKSEIVNSTDSVSSTIQLVDSGEIAGLSSGFPSLDRYFTLTKGSFIVLAARPAMGKTALADQIAENVARTGEPVLFASLEMPHEELTIRRISRLSGVPMHEIVSGNISQSSRGAIISAGEKLSRIDMLFTYDNPSATIREIAAAARKIKRQYGRLGLVVIDYLQQIIEGSSGGGVQEMTAIARNSKVMARELDTTVIGLSQLSRAVEYRNDKRPLLSDLRESGGIEQAANIVFFIYREEYYEENPDPAVRGKAELIVRKNRNGPLGTAYINFDSALARFRE